MSKPSLGVQLNQIDYYLAQPGDLDNSSLQRVPVLRIYGTSSVDKKACVHVHQVYPYFYVEYSGQLDPPRVKLYISKFMRSLNYAIAVSVKRNLKSSEPQFLRAALLVKGIPFYGFHSSYSPFLKILLTDPAIVHRAVSILQSGTVMHTRFRVFESHSNYILQFLSDFNLYGCGWVEIGEFCYRGHDDGPENHNVYSLASLGASSYYRQTQMPVEVDVVAHQILNRHRLHPRKMHDTLRIPADPLPSDPLILSIRELWEDERKRRLARGLHPSPEMPIDLSDRSRGPGGSWMSEERWWNEIRSRISRGGEDKGRQANEIDKSWEDCVMTTFESIEALWDPQWKSWKPSGRSDTANASNMIVESSISAASSGLPLAEDVSEEMVVEVDENLLTNEDLSDIAPPDGLSQQFDPVQGENVDDDLSEGTEGDFDHTEDIDESTSFDDTRLPFEGDHQYSIEQVDDVRHSNNTESSQQKPQALEGFSGSSLQNHISSRGNTPSRNSNESIEGLAVNDQLKLSSTYSVLPSDEQAFRYTLDRENDVPYHQSSDLDILHASLMDNDQRAFKRRKIEFSNNSSVQQVPRFRDHQSVRELTPHRTQQLQLLSCISQNPNKYTYAPSPPTKSELLESLANHDIPSKIYRDPFYSKQTDAPHRLREYAGLVYQLKSEGLDTLDIWQGSFGLGDLTACGEFDEYGLWGWEYASHPPSRKQVKKWLASNKLQLLRQIHDKHSQIEGTTQTNVYGLKYTPRTSDSSRERQEMTVLSMEVFALSREDYTPAADVDKIVAVFYSLQSRDTGSDKPILQAGVIVVAGPQVSQYKQQLRRMKVDIVETELELLNRTIDKVVELDPDILVGWEVQKASWGYLYDRGRQYGFEVDDLIARAPSNRTGGDDQWGARHTSTFKVAGRHVFNLWRIMRSELTLNIYSFENVAFQLLRRRVPRYSFATLVRWYNSQMPAHIVKVIDYFAKKTAIVLEMLDEIDVVTKTAEFARVFGVDFFSVISRGSQYKVESFMFRMAKPESFVFLSPSKSDVGKQNAAECMPLIMEPLSAFYNSPLVVLDFQSLYPSIMIAYNYCYSTCLGRIVEFQGHYKFGVTDLDIPTLLLEKLQDHIRVAPNGIMYVKPEVRKGLLARMLTELLDTRVMVKQAMKGVKDDKTLRKILDARQLGLKYICNVTYGYTGATFSGRMPAVEIADSIVQSGRETLEKAISVINSTSKWGAQVVYGDTDSIFVYLKGKTKEEAFRIGYDIANTITALNPAPIKLKFEKVYLPCVLMAKKRYVGFKYENLDDQVPVFDAKGIETVRRDGIPAQQKMTENCLKKLFRSQDLSDIKAYCCRTWTKILEGKVSLQDFIFAKEVRMGTYSDVVPPPPGAAVAARRILKDPNDEPQYGERVPYVITRGAPGSRLVERAFTPQEVLNSYKHLDADYYISRVLIPPLERIFNLLGVDVRSWYYEMPKPAKGMELSSPSKHDGDFNINDHFQSSQCLICGGLAWNGICDNCRAYPQQAMAEVAGLIRRSEQHLHDAHQVCSSCTGSAPLDVIECESLDCPWMFERKKAERKGELVELLQNVLETSMDSDDEVKEEDEELPVFYE